MGVTIHYQGHLSDPKQLPGLIAAIQQTCRTLDWPYVNVDERIIGTAEVLILHPGVDDEELRWSYETSPVDDRWRGVIVSPPGSEPVWLTFNRSGQMIVYDASDTSFSTPGHYLARDMLFTKTQFSSTETHIAVCDLLRLAEQYGAELEVTDEGGYWESNDIEQLQQRMDFLNSALDMMQGEAGREVLEEILGIEIEGEIEIEVGKTIERPLPDWRRDWGISAGEN